MAKKAARTWAIGILAAIGGWTSLAHAQVQFRTVTTSEQSPPGAPGRQFHLISTPVINDSGDVLFGASENETFSARHGLWRTSAGNLQLVALDRTPAPEPPGEAFEWLYDSLIDASGRVLLVTTTNAHQSGLWFGPPDDLRVMAYEGVPAPGFPEGYRMGGPAAEARLNPSGVTVFEAWIRPPPDLESAHALYVGSPGNLQLVAKTGDPAPGLPPGSTFVLYPTSGIYTTPSIDRGGRIVFHDEAVIGGAPSGTLRGGIWSGTPGDLHLVALEGSPAPGAAPGQVFDAQFGLPRIAGGKTVFVAKLAGPGVDVTNDRGVWVGPPGSLQLAAREGSAVPGATAGLLFGEPIQPVTNSFGHLAFAANLTGAGVNTANDSAIFIGPAGDVRLAAREGDAAPASPGAAFGEFDNPSINESGWLAFAATLTGSGVNNANDRGIWIRDPLGQLSLIAREGNPLDVGGGDLRVIAALEMLEAGAAREDGVASPLNNASQLAFQASFTDGTSGVFIATVPEPASASLVLFIAGLMRGRRQRR